MRNWWNSTTEMQFFSKAKCMVDQYSNYTSAQVGIPLDGVRTLDENMADNGGVRQSYIAYGKTCTTELAFSILIRFINVSLLYND